MTVSTDEQMKGIEEILNDLKNISRDVISEEPLVIGRIKDFSEHQLLRIFEENVYVVDDVIMLAGRESEVHKYSKEILCNAFQNLPKNFIYSGVEHGVKYVDKLRCGSVYIKRVDGSLRIGGEKNILIPFEVAFSNESYDNFFYEGMNYVNQYSTSNYFIGIKIAYRRAVFRADFIVLEKILETEFAEIKNISENLEKTSFYHEKKYCEKLKGEPKASAIFFHDNRTRLHFHRIINEDNYQEDFSFVLNGPKVHHSLTEDVIVLISGAFIAIVHDEYHTHRRNQNH